MKKVKFWVQPLDYMDNPKGRPVTLSTYIKRLEKIATEHYSYNEYLGPEYLTEMLHAWIKRLPQNVELKAVAK